MIKIVIVFFSIVLFFAIFGCSSTGQMIVENKNTDDESAKSGIINENFQPSMLGENELGLKKTISPESKSDDIDDLLLQSPEKTPLPEELDGFRVQICAASDEEKA